MMNTIVGFWKKFPCLRWIVAPPIFQVKRSPLFCFKKQQHNNNTKFKHFISFIKLLSRFTVWSFPVSGIKWIIPWLFRDMSEFWKSNWITYHQKKTLYHTLCFFANSFLAKGAGWTDKSDMIYIFAPVPLIIVYMMLKDGKEIYLDVRDLDPSPENKYHQSSSSPSSSSSSSSSTSWWLSSTHHHHRHWHLHNFFLPSYSWK